MSKESDGWLKKLRVAATNGDAELVRSLWENRPYTTAKVFSIAKPFLSNEKANEPSKNPDFEGPDKQYEATYRYPWLETPADGNKHQNLSDWWAATRQDPVLVGIEDVTPETTPADSPPPIMGSDTPTYTQQPVNQGDIPTITTEPTTINKGTTAALPPSVQAEIDALGILGITVDIPPSLYGWVDAARQGVQNVGYVPPPNIGVYNTPPPNYSLPQQQPINLGNIQAGRNGGSYNLPAQNLATQNTNPNPLNQGWTQTVWTPNNGGNYSIT